MFTALKSIGDRAVPYAVAMLSNGDARPQAVEYLVEAGQPAVPWLLLSLRSDNKDVQLASVEALGKLRAREATVLLVEQYGKAETADKLRYLTALGSIADPTTEQILSNALGDDSLDASMKEQAALGLGRIASPTSVRRLWSLLPNEDLDLTDSTISALQLAGDESLRMPQARPDLLLRVASTIQSPAADAVIRDGLSASDRSLRRSAIRTAAKRPGLVPDLTALLPKLNPEDDGDEIDAAVASLVSTPEGQTAIQPLQKDPVVAAFMKRRETLSRPQG